MRGGKAQARGFLAAGLATFALQLIHAPDELMSTRAKALAGRRQGHAVHTPHKQLSADPILQGAHAAAECRLRNVPVFAAREKLPASARATKSSSQISSIGNARYA